MDSKAWRNNVIKDMLGKREGENTKQLVEKLWRSPNQITLEGASVKQAYRLGPRRHNTNMPPK